MKTASQLTPAGDYERIAKAISYIRDNARLQPSLEQIASRVGLSPWHFQRKFKAWVGVSPKRFLEFLTVQHARELLDKSTGILAASLDLGCSGPGRLHAQFVSIEAMTPDQYKQFGSGLQIYYGTHPSPVGMMLLVLTDKGICELAFGSEERLDREAKDLERRWPAAQIFHAPHCIGLTADTIFNPQTRTQAGSRPEFHLLVKGTDFQVKVWRALLMVPEGSLISYKQLARLTGHSAAVRATATAVGANPVSYLIPCHRILRSSGELGGYHWGIERKKALIAWDSARAASVTETVLDR